MLIKVYRTIPDSGPPVRAEELAVLDVDDDNPDNLNEIVEDFGGDFFVLDEGEDLEYGEY